MEGKGILELCLIKFQCCRWRRCKMVRRYDGQIGVLFVLMRCHRKVLNKSNAP